MTASVKPGPEELFRSLGPAVYEEAYTRGMSLSAYLNEIHPQDEYKDGMDGFSRMLKMADIKVRSLPRDGVWADKLDKFGTTSQGRALFPEWVARQWRRASTGYDEAYREKGERALYSSVDFALNTWGRPYVDDPTPRFRIPAPPIPLEQIVALTTPIDGDAYRTFYLTDDPTQERRIRVGQGAEVPRARLSGTQHTVTMYKFGRAIEITYEDLRRQRIDFVAFQIARMAVQAEVDKVAAALDVLVSGDGNSNTAATNYNLSTLDSGATVGQLSLKAWLAFKLKFLAPYVLTTAIVQDTVALQAFMLNTGSANIPLVYIQGPSGFGQFRPINPGLADSVSIGWTPAAPSLKVVAFDARFALQQVVEIGADITELARYIERQTQLLVMTEVMGFATLDPLAVKTLNINA